RIVGLAELGRQGHAAPGAEELTDDECVVAELAGVEVLAWADVLRGSLELRRPVFVVLVDRRQGAAALQASPVLLAVPGESEANGAARRSRVALGIEAHFVWCHRGPSGGEPIYAHAKPELAGRAQID